MPGCNDTCGKFRIPFPFGMGPTNCFYNEWFQIECINSTKPFLSKLKIQILDIPFESRLRLSFGDSLIVAAPPLTSCSPQHHTQIDLTGNNCPYKYSGGNVLMMQGCSGNAMMMDSANNITAGCSTVCNSSTDTTTTTNCNGVGCCQAPILDYDYKFYQISFDQQNSSGSSACLSASLIDPGSVAEISYSDPSGPFPVSLKWSWTASSVQSNGGFCNGANHYGNPYVPNGCQVPEECKPCQHRWCHANMDGEGSISFNCDVDMLRRRALILGPSITVGVLLLAIGLYKLFRFVKRRREMKRRAKFFKRNGGLLLKQQLSANEGAMEEAKVFNVDELDKATDHFNENRILGKGGQGTVYKGMLVDGRIVAIKKANLLDESQLEQFINEVVILSQINHRNVVRMLGCCLETEVPLLVYEFIPNGTLSDHIHDDLDEDSIVLTWEMRLKIAADSASAVAYLHSSTSIPIFHRDIKSLNILLDEKHRARVSDFGSSKTIAIDQTHMTTLVQGTLGYLDPEYFQSYQFTEKSDVYSFGVVLLELLTGRNPIYMDAGSMEQKNLVTEFSFLSQRDKLSDILDHEIVKQAKEEELITVIELAKRCTSMSGRLRPTMKEVAMTLEMIMKSPTEVPTGGERAFQVPQEVSSKNAMGEKTYTEFISNPLPARAAIQPMSIEDKPPMLITL